MRGPVVDELCSVASEETLERLSGVVPRVPALDELWLASELPGRQPICRHPDVLDPSQVEVLRLAHDDAETAIPGLGRVQLFAHDRVHVEIMPRTDGQLRLVVVAERSCRLAAPVVEADELDGDPPIQPLNLALMSRSRWSQFGADLR